MATRHAVHSCDFCTREVGQVELLFKSHVGGCRIGICSDCVLWFGEIVAAHRSAPSLAASLIEAHNAAAECGRKEADTHHGRLPIESAMHPPASECPA